MHVRSCISTVISCWKLNSNNRQLPLFSIIDDMHFPSTYYIHIEIREYVSEWRRSQNVCTVESKSCCQIPWNAIVSVSRDSHFPILFRAQSMQWTHPISVLMWRFLWHFCMGLVIINRLYVSRITWASQMLQRNYQLLFIAPENPLFDQWKRAFSEQFRWILFPLWAVSHFMHKEGPLMSSCLSPYSNWPRFIKHDGSG
jgi:hypothetical protein